MTRAPSPTALLFLAALIAAGCSSAPRPRPAEDHATPQETGQPAAGHPTGSPTEQYGPSASDETSNHIEYGPEPMKLKPVTLVFGPGMARGFAHVGVLRALAEHKIPIGAIYGSEMGGLVGALYATDSNLNHFEWSLIKLKDDIFTTDRGMIGRLFAGGESTRGDPDRLEEQLKKIFGDRDIAQAQIPLWIEVQMKSASTPSLRDKGGLVPALRAAIGSNGFFGPGTLDGQQAGAASDSLSVTYLCAEARAQSGGPVVLIDTAVGRDDPSAADLVIRPDLDGIGPTDFSHRSEAAFRGSQAVVEHLPELRRWVGLPEEPGPERPAP